VFAIEKEVVRNELRLGNETSVGGKAFDILAGALPGEHPMHRRDHRHPRLAGRHHHGGRRAWVKKYYRPRTAPSSSPATSIPSR
jgi:hypothetical protein